MADAGASTMIILVASLLVSGVASVVLIEAWGDLAESSDKITSKRAADLETDVAISGDRGHVFLDTSANPNEITLFFENTGTRHLNTTTFGIFVDGVAVGTGSSMTLYPASGVWAPGTVMSVIVSDTAFNSYSATNTAMVTIVAKSEATGGYIGSASATEEVRFFE